MRWTITSAAVDFLFVPPGVFRTSEKTRLQAGLFQALRDPGRAAGIRERKSRERL